MLRRLAFFAVLLSVTQARMSACGQVPNARATDSHQQTNVSSNRENSTHKALSIPPEVNVIKALEPKPYQSNVGGDHSAMIVSESAPMPEVWRWYEKIAWVGNISLVFVGICGIKIALATLRNVERQTKATQIAADAALTNAKAFIKSERPWILVDIEVSKSNPDDFVVFGINKGQTPAEVCEGHCSCEPQNPFCFVPPDAINDPFFGPRQVLTVPGDRFEIRTINVSYLEKVLNGSPLDVMYVYGKLTYWDTFTDRTEVSAEPCITEWIFAYDLQNRKFYRPAISYSKHT